MIVAVTGSRHGGSDAQLEELRVVLLRLGATELHHGDCVGVDAQSHAIGRELRLRIVVHPPLMDAARAWCAGDVVLPPMGYIPRDHALVDASAYLIALPDGPERLRSGTWLTVRYARRRLGDERIKIIYS